MKIQMNSKITKGDLVLIDNDYDFELGIVSWSSQKLANVVTNDSKYCFSIVQLPPKYLTLISKAEFAPATSNS